LRRAGSCQLAGKNTSLLAGGGSLAGRITIPSIILTTKDFRHSAQAKKSDPFAEGRPVKRREKRMTTRQHDHEKYTTHRQTPTSTNTHKGKKKRGKSTGVHRTKLGSETGPWRTGGASLSLQDKKVRKRIHFCGAIRVGLGVRLKPQETWEGGLSWDTTSRDVGRKKSDNGSPKCKVITV